MRMETYLEKCQAQPKRCAFGRRHTLCSGLDDEILIRAGELRQPVQNLIP
jgi:hypothetical protein